MILLIGVLVFGIAVMLFLIICLRRARRNNSSTTFLNVLKIILIVEAVLFIAVFAVAIVRMIM